MKLRLTFIVMALLLIAYARPQTSEGTETVRNEGIELMILFDVSNSMLAEDVKPSRMEFAKREVERFLDMSGGNRVGLVAFAGSAVTLSPMTTDRNAMKMFIESLRTDAVSTQGTDIQAALREAKDGFSRGGLGEEEGVAVTRAVLLISDGEELQKGALDFADEIKKQGIHVFSVAVGTEGGGPIPIRDANGVLRGYKRDKGGEVIMTKTQGTVLKELAKAGDGSFHHLSFSGNVMAQVRADIEKLQKAQFESGQVASYNEMFQWVLLLALLIAALEMWLGERQSAGRIWKGRFEVAEQ